MKRRGLKLKHTFRSRVLGLTAVGGRIFALTERGIYLKDRRGKRWRKVASQPRSDTK